MIHQKLPLHEVYDQRQGFVIVALTGITGSGCSDFAELMSKVFNKWTDENYIRSIEEIDKIPVNKKSDLVFKKEYKACYNACSTRYEQPFIIIKYRDVIVLHSLLELTDSSADKRELIERWQHVLEGKFHHSYTDDGDAVKYSIDNKFPVEIIESWGLTDSLYDSLRGCKDNLINLSDLFLNNQQFKDFCYNMFQDMKRRDYYAKNFFVHRLGNTIRATGRCEPTHDECLKSDNSNVFTIVELIKQIIKGYHLKDSKAARRFVIDSVRCSLELLYLRERYNAFYAIAIHNDGREQALIEKKVRKFENDKAKVKAICDNLIAFNKNEASKKDFENGVLFAPDIERCVTESEIHVEYQVKDTIMGDDTNHNDLTTLSFYTFGEQWMKFYALIMRPGIITPSRDERCMAIAYVAKFNSGCLSRQVGCTIVDNESAVQSVGWNDPPAPQLPCNLRYADDLIEFGQSQFDQENPESYREFSKFELTDKTKYELKDKNGEKHYYGDGFCNCMDLDLNRKALQIIHKAGLAYPYCFRTQYNKFNGNRDQVNTRSLHAEENTMLRIARKGGVGLDGGTMYVTASPCVLCSKKAYQIGIRDIVYLDIYTDIAPNLILECGFNIPRLRPFRGAIGGTFYKLYQPFLPYKDELAIYNKFYK